MRNHRLDFMHEYHVINTSCHEYSLSMTTSSGISWRHRFEQIDTVIVNISGDPKSSHVPATTVRIIQGIHDATVWLPVSWACLVEAQAWKQDSKHSKRDATNHLEVSDCDMFVDFLHVCLTGHFMASRHRDIRDISPWLVSKHQTVQTTRHIPTARNQRCHAPSVGKSRRNLGCLGQWHLRMSLCRCWLCDHLPVSVSDSPSLSAVCFHLFRSGYLFLSRQGRQGAPGQRWEKTEQKVGSHTQGGRFRWQLSTAWAQMHLPTSANILTDSSGVSVSLCSFCSISVFLSWFCHSMSQCIMSMSMMSPRALDNTGAFPLLANANTSCILGVGEFWTHMAPDHSEPLGDLARLIGKQTVTRLQQA